MTRFPSSLTLGVTIVVLSGSIASAAVPPTVVWSDNFPNAIGTGISTLPGWAAIPGFNTLTSYVSETAFQPPYSARTYGMNQNAVFTLEQTVTGMSGYTSQWFHFKGHKAQGTSTTVYDECRVATSGGAILGFKIAARQVIAFTVNPTADSPLLGDQLSLSAWREFDVRYDNTAGSQTVTFYINNAVVWTTSVTNPGYITKVQFVQQGGAKPASSENHLIGEMRVGTADCIPPGPPTGIAASASPICNGASSMLSVNDPGAGLTTDWFTVSCGGTPVVNGTGVNSVSVSPTATTTYYARTRDPATTCVSATCQSVTVTIPNCSDGNACTTDTCSNGVCGHTNVANGTACEDGDPCTQNDTCQNGTCASGPPVIPCNTTNGFDPDRIYVIRGGTWDSEVRMLNENAADPLHSDMGPFGTQAFQTWPAAVATLLSDENGGQDASIVKSICFSNSPAAGQNSPAGVRFFGVYDVRALDEPNTSIDETTYSSSGFQIVELNSAGKRIRVMKVGLASNLNPGNTSTDALTDLCWHGCSEGADPVDYRNNTNGCRVGNIRYNRAKNTLCVAANIGEHDDGDPCRPPVGRVYEFELPDWEEVYYTAQNAPSPNMVGQPVPQSDPNVVKLVQIYEMPSRCETSQGTRYDVDRCECLNTLGGTWYGHSVLQEHCTGFHTGRNEGQRPVITFDDAGNMYFTSRFFSATGSVPPDAGCPTWRGAGLWWGDVLRCNTLGHWAGKNKYVVPVTGADAGNLVIQAQIEDALVAGYPPNAAYDGGPGLAVRGNQLIQLAEIECNDLSVGPYSYVNVFDLTSTVGGSYPNELVRLKSLSNDRCDIPRKPNYAQLDETSGKTFLSDLMGACDCAQNFMYVVNNYPVDTVVHDVGYFLDVLNPNGSSAGNLTHDWDAASPPAIAIDQVGACCLTAQSCQSLSQTACAAAHGFWQGNGTACGQFSCLLAGGACYRPCTPCQQTLEPACEALPGGVWAGLGTVCGQNPPLVCSVPSVDGDCDGDVDMNDFGILQRCYNPGGPIPTTPEHCACFDIAGGNPNGPDGVIDHFDFDAFMNCALAGTPGAGVPAPPCP